MMAKEWVERPSRNRDERSQSEHARNCLLFRNVTTILPGRPNRGNVTDDNVTDDRRTFVSSFPDSTGTIATVQLAIAQLEILRLPEPIP